MTQREERLDRAARLRVLTSPAALVEPRALALEGLARRARAVVDGQLGRAATLVEQAGSGLERQSPMARLARVEERLGALEGRLGRVVEQRIQTAGERLDRAAKAQASALERSLERATRRLEPAARTLNAVSPLAVLERGYSITQTAEGEVLTDAAALPVGSKIKTILKGGEVDSTVIATRPKGGDA